MTHGTLTGRFAGASLSLAALLAPVLALTPALPVAHGPFLAEYLFIFLFRKPFFYKLGKAYEYQK